MPLAIYLREIDKHGSLQFVHNFTLSVLSSNRDEYSFTLPRAVLYKLTLATRAPTLPVSTDIRGAL